MYRKTNQVSPPLGQLGSAPAGKGCLSRGAPSAWGQERGRSGKRTAGLPLASLNLGSVEDMTGAEALSSEGLSRPRLAPRCHELPTAPSGPVLLRPWPYNRIPLGAVTETACRGPNPQSSDLTDLT